MRTKFFGSDLKIGVIGLGYVGLPLAGAFSRKFKVVGFDINKKRIEELTKGIDRTGEIHDASLLKSGNLTFTDDLSALKSCRVLVVAVPTPVDRFKKPDLKPVLSASETVGKVIQPGAIAVFESTVYPGLTEQECGPVIEKISGLKHGKDFFLGYSPERVNPGDRLHTIEKIVKVVAGCNPEITDILAELYGSIIEAGVHKAPSIAAAEAAKVIENTQRDINIALINELSQIFDRIGLDTNDVLAASRTKWNFLDFRPGLVGGHCIGVDPYYLTHMAEGTGFHPEIINSGRRINDSMAKFIAEKTIKMIRQSRREESGEIRVAILGVTFKEDVPDLRNTKVVDLMQELEAFGVRTYAFDPIADSEEFHEEYNRNLTKWDEIPACDAVILAVKHKKLLEGSILSKISSKLSSSKVIIDVKACLDRDEVAKNGMKIWRP